MKPKQPPGPPMTLGNMREPGVGARLSRLQGLSQDEEERGGVVNRGARDARTSVIRRLHAIMPRHQATPIRRGRGCLWAKAGSRLLHPEAADAVYRNVRDIHIQLGIVK
jgi:hypothetical protein